MQSSNGTKSLGVNGCNSDNGTIQFDPFAFVQQILKQNFCLPNSESTLKQQQSIDDDDDDDDNSNNNNNNDENHTTITNCDAFMVQQLRYDVPRCIDLNDDLYNNSNYNNNSNSNIYRQRFISDDIFDVTDHHPQQQQKQQTFNNNNITGTTIITTQQQQQLRINPIVPKTATVTIESSSDIAHLGIISNDSYDDDDDDDGNHEIHNLDCIDKDEYIFVDDDDYDDGCCCCYTTDTNTNFTIREYYTQRRRFRITKGLETFLYGILFFTITIYILQQLQKHQQEQEHDHHDHHHVFWTIQYKQLSSITNNNNNVPVEVVANRPYDDSSIHHNGQPIIEQVILQLPGDNKNYIIMKNTTSFVSLSSSSSFLCNFVPSSLSSTFDLDVLKICRI